MAPGKEKQFFTTLQWWRRSRSEFPTEIIVENKFFYGDQVLTGFAHAAYLQSRDPTMEKYRVSPHHTSMKTIVHCETC